MKRDRYYKGKYIIAFYGSDNDTLIHIFDNVRQIVEYRGEEVNLKNLQNVTRLLYYALKKQNHVTEMLNKGKMYVYIVDFSEEERRSAKQSV